MGVTGAGTAAFGGQSCSSKSESVDNFEVNDIDAYWSFNEQVYHQVKDLPPGTPITSVKATGSSNGEQQ